MKLSFNLIAVMAAFIGCCAFVGCTKVPDDVLEKEKMAALLADIHTGEAVVDANSSMFPDDSTKRVFKQSIYAHHGLTSEQVDRSFRWYGNHMDKYIEVYDRVLEIINEEMEDAQQRAGVAGVRVDTRTNLLAFEGDSVDVWNDVRFRPYASNLSSEHLPFVLRADNNWEHGDAYTFRYKLVGNTRSALLSVAVFYSDGVTEYMTKSFIGEGWHDVSFAVDSARTAREIYGSISYEVVQNERVFVDSISLVRTRWSPWKKSLRQPLKIFNERRRSRAFD